MTKVNKYVIAYAGKETVLTESEYKKFQTCYKYHNTHGLTFEAYVHYMTEEKGIIAL